MTRMLTIKKLAILIMYLLLELDNFSKQIRVNLAVKLIESHAIIDEQKKFPEESKFFPTTKQFGRVMGHSGFSLHELKE